MLRVALTIGFLLLNAPPAAAQYMWLTTDNPADSTQLNATGTTILTITLDTIHDRDGSPQVCNSHTNQQGCGTVLTGQPLDLFSYTITLSANGGTVAWGTFAAADPAYESLGPDLADDHQTEFTRNAPVGYLTPPGRVVLGTLAVTVLSGTPSIQIARGTQPVDPFGFGTGFGTSCDGFLYSNTYMLGNPFDACSTGDWYDADGAPRGPPIGPNLPPTLSHVADMRVNVGSTSDQTVSASDPEGTPLLFLRIAGPIYMSVTNTSFTTGNIRLAPRALSDAGCFANLRVTDGLANTDQKFTIFVTQGGDGGPLIQPIADVTMNEGETQVLDVGTVNNTGQQNVTFGKLGGPFFMTVATIAGLPPRGRITLAPGPLAAGDYTGIVTASSGSLRSSWSFHITVIHVDQPPTATSTGPGTILEGTTSTMTFQAVDPDGDDLCLRPIGLPHFATSPEFACGPGGATLPIQFSPDFSDAGTYPLSVSLSSTHFLTSIVGSIVVQNVNRPPQLDSIPDLEIHANEVLDRSFSASDPDGDALRFTKVSGPSFATVTTISPSAGLLHLAPAERDLGTHSMIVRAEERLEGGDGIPNDTQGFIITVTSKPNRCPTANAGGPYTGLQGVPIELDGTASSDPDGDALTYAWDFDAADGIQVDGTGSTIDHTFATAGTRMVTLTVRDAVASSCSSSASATANIFPSCPARAFNGFETIRLGPGRPTWSVLVQPEDGCYTNADVRLDTFTLAYGDKQIVADPAKTSVSEDKNHDGVNEIQATFSKQNLRTLFAGAGLTGGHNLVTLTVEASLTAGGRLRGTTQVEVQNNIPSGSEAVVSPNPLNPQATLTYTVKKPGAIRIELFDIHGRLVRSLAEEPYREAGTFDLPIDGFDALGRRLPSGVYFLRGRTPGNEFKSVITVLK